MKGDIHRNDKLGVVGAYNFHFNSLIPSKTLNYASLVKPYDGFTWSLICISFALIMLSLMVIDKVFSSVGNTITSNSFYTSISKNV